MWGGDKHHYQWPGDGALRLDIVCRYCRYCRYCCVECCHPGSGPGTDAEELKMVTWVCGGDPALERRLWRWLGLGWGHLTTDTGFTRTQDTGVEWGNCNHMTDMNWEFFSDGMVVWQTTWQRNRFIFCMDRKREVNKKQKVYHESPFYLKWAKHHKRCTCPLHVF